MTNTTDRWEAAQAWAWYLAQRWICGFNYVPSTAINTTEFWQQETFDPATIDRELGWAGEVGFNSCRVFIQYLVWTHDPGGLIGRLDAFCGLARRHGLSVMPVLFDDCAFSGKQPYLGPQEAPVPGVHNSGWTPSPGHARVDDPAAWPDLERYVMALVGHFAADERIIAWDLYNEPGNSDLKDRSLPLTRASFEWARRAAPTQPLTVGTWNATLTALNEASLANSDIITFHSYGDLPALEREITELKPLGRPLLCTEWMARHRHSLWATHLPVFKREGIACYSWGLAQGKTQTCFPWGSPMGAPEPELWFHDILRRDGTPYRAEEIEIIRQHTR